MLQSAELARQISDRLVAIFADLEQTIELVKNEEPETLQQYRKSIGSVCGALVLDVMAPIYKQHPSVKPASWADIQL